MSDLISITRSHHLMTTNIRKSESSASTGAWQGIQLKTRYTRGIAGHLIFPRHSSALSVERSARFLSGLFQFAEVVCNFGRPGINAVRRVRFSGRNCSQNHGMTLPISQVTFCFSRCVDRRSRRRSEADGGGCNPREPRRSASLWR